MTRFFFFAAFFIPVLAFAQVERAADVRASAGPVSGPSSLNAAPSPLPLSAAAPAAAPLAAPLPAPALAAAPAAAPAAALTPAAAPAPAPALARPAARPTAMLPARETVLRAAAPAETGADSGRLTFDGQAARSEDAAVATGLLAAADGPRLARPTTQAPAAAPSIPLTQRLGETAELGVMSLGFHMVTGLAFLLLGAHASFPLLAGALWALAGAELIKQLGSLRSVIVGGWQASHDQKMRTDYSTGRLRDIRGRKYGEDRYDERAPGAVSPRERLVTDAAAFALGLPWVLPAGPQAVALYAAGAAAVFAVRRALARRAKPAPVRRTDFEYDR